MGYGVGARPRACPGLVFPPTALLDETPGERYGWHRCTKRYGRLAAGAAGVTSELQRYWHAGVDADGYGSRCRLLFRLIRLRSLPFAYYRVKFSTQVTNGGD